MKNRILVKVLVPAIVFGVTACGASLQKKDAMEILDNAYKFRSEFQSDCSVQADVALQTALAEKGIAMTDWQAYKEKNSAAVSELEEAARKKHCQ